MGRVAGVRDGRPELGDGAALDVANVVWCTGFRTDFSWIDRPAFREGDEPAHERGVVTEEPGMYMVGQLFQYALASTFIAGVGRDADHVARVIAAREGARAARTPIRSQPSTSATSGSGHVTERRTCPTPRGARR